MAGKQVSSPWSTGGMGPHFETRVQAAFAVMMIVGGYAPCMPRWPITSLKLQGKYKGFETDDLIISSQSPGAHRKARLLGQIKHSIAITKSSSQFGEVIQAAWLDSLHKDFRQDLDVLALITGPLSKSDTNGVRRLLQEAQHSEDHADFFDRVGLARFCSNTVRDKLSVFSHHLKAANEGVALTDIQLWQFLSRYRLLIFDLDIRGVVLSLLHTMLANSSNSEADEVLSQVQNHVEWVCENAGTISRENLPDEIKKLFRPKAVFTMPAELWTPVVDGAPIGRALLGYAEQVLYAALIGCWHEDK